MAESQGGLPQVLRTGRKVGRTVYVMTGGPPERDDLVGVMDTAELAAMVAAAVNVVVLIGEHLADPRFEGDATAAVVRRLLEPAWVAVGTALHPEPDE